jgi:hypothetical protein
MLTKYFKKKIQDYLFGQTAYTSPATYYIGLLVVAGDNDGNYTEANYGGYTRIGVANNKTTFTVAADDNYGTINNDIEIRFPVATSGSSDVVEAGYFDAETGGNLLMTGTYVKSFTVADRPVIEANGLSIKIKGSGE